jgi:hypothetical protein
MRYAPSGSAAPARTWTPASGSRARPPAPRACAGAPPGRGAPAGLGPAWRELQRARGHAADRHRLLGRAPRSGGLCHRRPGGLGNGRLARPPPAPEREQRAGDPEKGEARHARDQCQRAGDPGQEPERPRAAEELLPDVFAEPLPLVAWRDAGHHQPRGHRDAERGHLAHQPVADRDEGVAGQRLLSVEPALEHAHQHAADEVHPHDDQTGEDVTLHELHCPVHRPEHLRLALQAPAALARGALVDEPGPEVGVDGHLLAGHGVEGEARRDLAHPLGALGHHQELHQRHHREHHAAHHVVAPHDELAERLDDRPGVSVGQGEPGGGDVQRQPEQRGHQEQRGERAQLQRARRAEGRHQQRGGGYQIERQPEVEEPARQRHHQRAEDGGHQAGQQQLATLERGGEELP